MSDTTDIQTHIAIVGAGFCGVALARALAMHAPAGTRAALIGTADDFGRGLAYAHVRPEHALNVRAKDMGIDPSNLGGFADWLQLEGEARDGFASRRAYGDFINAELDAALARNAPRLTLDRIAARVLGIERGVRGFTLSFDDGTKLQARQVVLATGTLPPSPLPQLDPALRATPHYLESPWLPGALERIDADADVLVVGTGLTFADIAATLQVRGHRGRVLAISRHGLRPQVQPDSPLPPFALPPEVLAAWDRGNVKAVLHELHRAAKTAPDWRALIDALRPRLQSFWKSLDATQRKRFLRHAASYWDIHRHRLSPETAAKLKALQASGQLRIEAARLVSAKLVDGRVEAQLRPRHGSGIRAASFDVLVRATGLVLDLRSTRHEPYARLIAQGLMQADPLGLGVIADDQGRVLDAAGAPVPGLSVLGPLQRPQFWEITAVPELRVAALALGQRLAGELASELRL